MAKQTRLLVKSYAMARMGKAIERAISAGSNKEKTRAATWAAAWGLLCGINTKHTYLRNDTVSREESEAAPGHADSAPRQLDCMPPAELAEREISPSSQPPAALIPKHGARDKSMSSDSPP